MENRIGRPFSVSFAAISATSFCFILRALVIDDWGVQFGLSETQKGELLGVGLWPFAITIILLSLVIDKIGFRATYWFAALCHLLGLSMLIVADGYWMLYVGTFVMALGNGAVEAAANPLVATIYADNKPKWLNLLHAAWPGGMIVGGLLALALGGSTGWQTKVALMFIPVLAYVALLVSARFPLSERVSSGVSYRAMLAEAGWVSALIVSFLIMLEIGRVLGMGLPATLVVVAILTALYAFYARSAGRPLYIFMVLLMIPLAITELSTDSWISSLMEPELRSFGLQAGWVLVYTALIVFVIRLFAGKVIGRLGPLGTLAAASAMTACGLFLLADAHGLALLAAATLYGIGKSFFWGTSLAVGSDQFPRGGAVTLNILAGSGMLAAGIVGSALLGSVQDTSTTKAIHAYDANQGTGLASSYLTAKGYSLLGRYEAIDPLLLKSAGPRDRAVIATIRADAKKQALRSIAMLPIGMMIAYLLLMVMFRRRGGYRPVQIAAQTSPPG